MGRVGWSGERFAAVRSSPLLRGKCKVRELGFVTAATGLFRHHYDSQNTNTHTHSHTNPPPHPTPSPTTPPLFPPPAKTILSDNGGTLDATSVFSERCYN